ncbi:MAG: DinB family protein [Phycisphaerales bacterium]|nr:DinB family protein [Phycisphaerales bacterium]
MNTIDFIKASLANSSNMTLALINDLKDEPLAQPTSKGGNHALWILGHIAHTESSILHNFILGKETCPLDTLKEQFEYKTEPSTDADYPTFDELMAHYESAHAELLAYIETISEEDLDKPIECPEEWKPFFGTIGLCLGMCAMHPAFHYGQLADIRRSLGRKPLMA